MQRKMHMTENSTIERCLLTAVLLLLLLRSQAQAATVYRFDGDRLSGVYQLKVNGEAVPVTAFPNVDEKEYERIAAQNARITKWLAPEARFVGVHYAHLAGDGKLTVELTASGPIQTFSIHPHRRAVKATVAGNSLRFEIDQSEPRYFVIEVNKLPPFCLIVDPPEIGAPSPTAKNVVNAAQFLTDATGKLDQTDAFANAIAAVNGTDEILYIPPGVYLTDTIKLHQASNMSIYLAPGCLIRTKTSPPGKNVHALGISIDRSKNIRLFGRGCLDQQAYENFVLAGNDYRHRLPTDIDPKQTFPNYTAVPALSQSAVFVLNSQNIEIDGVTIRNSRNFHFDVINCDRLTLRRCKLLTPPACVPEFTDGIDVVSTDRLLIDGFFAFCNDDCFAWGNAPDTGPLVKFAQSRPLTNCVVRNMVGWNTRANAIRLGWHGDGSEVGIHDILFENCDFAGFESSGILMSKLKQPPGTTQPPRHGTLRFLNCGFDCERIHSRPFGGRKLAIDRLEFENVAFDVPSKPWVIEGTAEGAIGKVVFRNVTIGGKKVTNLSDADIHVKHAKKIVME
jgi:hypothetical protein